MPRVSTARLMLLFLGVSVGTSLLASTWRLMSEFFGRRSNPGVLGPLVVTLASSWLVTGWLQSWILARYRLRLPGWTLATALGGLTGGLVGYFSTRSLMGTSIWLPALVWAGTGAAFLGAAQAFAIWGRRWTSDALLWLAGLLVVRVLGAALSMVLHKAAERSLQAVIPLLSAAVVGAGTAWLLDRIVFHSPRGSSPRFYI